MKQGKRIRVTERWRRALSARAIFTQGCSLEPREVFTVCLFWQLPKRAHTRKHGLSRSQPIIRDPRISLTWPVLSSRIFWARIGEDSGGNRTCTSTEYPQTGAKGMIFRPTQLASAPLQAHTHEKFTTWRTLANWRRDARSETSQATVDEALQFPQTQNGKMSTPNLANHVSSCSASFHCFHLYSIAIAYLSPSNSQSELGESLGRKPQ